MSQLSAYANATNNQSIAKEKERVMCGWSLGRGFSTKSCPMQAVSLISRRYANYNVNFVYKDSVKIFTESCTSSM